MGQPIQNPPPWSKSKAVPSAVHDLFMRSGPGAAKWSPPKMKKLAGLSSAVSEGLDKQAYIPLITAGAGLLGRAAASSAVRSGVLQTVGSLAASGAMSGAGKLFARKPRPVQTQQQYAMPKVATLNKSAIVDPFSATALATIAIPAAVSAISSAVTLYALKKVVKPLATESAHAPAAIHIVHVPPPPHGLIVHPKPETTEKHVPTSNAMHKIAGAFGTTMANMAAKGRMMFGTPGRRSETTRSTMTTLGGHAKGLALSMGVPMALEAGIRSMSQPKKQKKPTQNAEQPGQQAGPPQSMF
jgi:hypothetical protein